MRLPRIHIGAIVVAAVVLCHLLFFSVGDYQGSEEFSSNLHSEVDAMTDGRDASRPAALHQRHQRESVYTMDRMGRDWCKRVAEPRGRNLSVLSAEGEVLYNGVQLPREWPPRDRTVQDIYNGKIISPFYLDPSHPGRPRVIPIDVGRQLFVDSFLSEFEDNIERHTGQFVQDAKPPFPRDLPVESLMISDGVWYDGEDGVLRIYYRCKGMPSLGRTGTLRTCVATSKDGFNFAFPDLRHRRPLAVGSGEATRPPGQEINCACQCGLGHDQLREFSAITLNDDSIDGSARYVAGYECYKGIQTRPLWVLHSRDGMGDWVRMPSPEDSYNSHTVHGYNPFRKVWVWIQRLNSCYDTRVIRVKRYAEGPTLSHKFKFWVQLPPKSDPVANVELVCPKRAGEGESVVWVGANPAVDTEPYSKWRQVQLGPESRVNIKKLAKQWFDRPPDLYIFSIVAYESVLLGSFTVWDGVKGDVFKKKFTAFVEFSRDGFNFPTSNPRRKLFEPLPYCSYAIVANGNFIIIGDEIHIFMSCEILPGRLGARFHRFRMRRDGFVGISAGRRNSSHPKEAASAPTPPEDGVLITRPLSSCGAHLFVNVDLGANGKLAVEVIDVLSAATRESPAITGFAHSEMDTLPTGLNSTKHQITWANGNHFGKANVPEFRLRFSLSGTAMLYSFWVAHTNEGASFGFLAGGQPGKNRLVDLP
jgi:hypothetical protein